MSDIYLKLTLKEVSSRHLHELLDKLVSDALPDGIVLSPETRAILEAFADNLEFAEENRIPVLEQRPGYLSWTEFDCRPGCEFDVECFIARIADYHRMDHGQMELPLG